MSDPLRTEAVPPPERPGPDDREARIEQLLLAGLDQYFAGEYEQAINIWTRVVFLERGHSRARAYIDRARGALAERHRESEELLHKGMAAFSSGETEAARDLITRAVQQGGPHDVALVLLERLNRLTAPAAGAVRRQPRVERGVPPPGAIAARPARRWLGVLAAAVVLAAVAAVVWSGMPAGDRSAGPNAVPRTPALAAEPLPLTRPSERLLARARALQAGGRLIDALRTLEAIDAADPLRAEADRLRGAVQRQLLASARPEAGR